MKVALVHYWLVNMAGGEKVLEALCRLYPQADIFTHVVDREKLLPRFRQHRISTTFIDSLPASRRLYKKYLPLMPHALEIRQGPPQMFHAPKVQRAGVMGEGGGAHLHHDALFVLFQSYVPPWVVIGIISLIPSSSKASW